MFSCCATRTEKQHFSIRRLDCIVTLIFRVTSFRVRVLWYSFVAVLAKDYHRIPVMSPGLIKFHKALLVG